MARLGIGAGLGLGSRGRATIVVAEQARVEGGGHQYHLRVGLWSRLEVRLELEGQRLS